MLFDPFRAKTSATSTVRPQTIDTTAPTRERAGMRWEERLLALFDDLEQQADGLALAERDALVAEQTRAEYAQVELGARLAGSVGGRVWLDVLGVGGLDGVLRRTGAGWLVLEAGSGAWVVLLPAVRRVRGLSDAAVDVAARPLTARLGVVSALRGLAETRLECALHGTDGQVTRAVLGRVGRDFAEVRPVDGPVEVVPFAAIAALRSG
jgi:hypothetical protein